MKKAMFIIKICQAIVNQLQKMLAYKIIKLEVSALLKPIYRTNNSLMPRFFALSLFFLLTFSESFSQTMITNAQATINVYAVPEASKNSEVAPLDQSIVTYQITRASECYRCDTRHRITDQSTGYSRLTYASNLEPRSFYKEQDPRNSQWKYSPTACGYSSQVTGFDGCASWQGNDIVFSINDNNKTCGSNRIYHSGNWSGFGGGTYVFHYSLPRFRQPYNYNDPNNELNGLDNLCDQAVTIATSATNNDTYIWQVSANVDGPWTTFQTNPPSVTNGHLVTVSENVFSTLIGDQDEYYIRLKGDEDCFFNRSSIATKVTFRKSAPASVTFKPISPTCPGGTDGVVEITGLRDANNNAYTLSGTLNYTLTNGNQTRNYSSTQQPSTANPIRLTSGGGLSITEGSWTVAIETEDPNGVCEKSFPVTITDPPQHSVYSSTIAQQVQCDGGTGSIRVAVQGGAPNFVYTLKNAANQTIQTSAATTATSYIFNTVPEGSYYTQITSCGTTVSSSGTSILDNPNATLAIANASFTNTTCKNLNNGTIAMSLAGGSGAYRYSVNNGAFQLVGSSTLSVTGLASGAYAIRIRDGNECEVSRNFEIDTPEDLTITNLGVADDINCPEGIGDIQVTSSGGAGPFSYRLYSGTTLLRNVNNTTDRTVTFSALTQGNYRVDVTDCAETISDNISLKDPTNPISFSVVTPVNVHCIGESNGQIQVGISGGSGNYQIKVDSRPFVNVTGSSHTLSGLAAGSHEIIISDNTLGCVATTQTTIGSPTPLSITSASVTQAVVCNQGTGEISVTVADGVAPFGYYITGDNGINRSALSRPGRTYTFTDLPVGTYAVRVDGCNETDSENSIALNNATDTLRITNLAGGNITCSDANDGNIVANFDGGASPYAIRLNAGSFMPTASTNSHTFNNIGPGNYTVVIQDKNNCETSGNIQVNNPAGVAIQSFEVADTIVCLGSSTGSIQVVAKGGAIDYFFELSGTQSTSFTGSQPSHTFTGLPSGSYQVAVSSCDLVANSTTNVVLTEPINTVDFGSVSSTNASCSTANNGTITINAKGGTAPYSTSIDGNTPVPMSGNSHSFTGLSATSHTITIVDANNCSAASSFPVDLAAPVVGSILPEDIQQVSCNGFDNGIAFITATGGGSSASYEYSINNGDFQSVNAFGGLAAQTHQVTVRLANAPSCSWSGEFDITEPEPIAIDTLVQTDYVSCFGEEDAALRIVSSGGPSPHSYQLLRGSEVIETGSEVFDYTFSGLAAGDYQLVLTTDVTGCGTQASFSINQPDQLIVELAISDYNGVAISCLDATDGSVSFVSTGGTYPHTVSSSGLTNQVINEASEEVNFSTLAGGDYSFSLTDDNGCTWDTTISLLAPEPLTTSTQARLLANGLPISCFGRSDASVLSLPMGGIAPYQITVNASDETVTVDSATFSGLSTGKYRFQTTDLNGCTVMDSITLVQPDSLVITAIDLSNTDGWNITCSGDTSGTATIDVAGGSFPIFITVGNRKEQISSYQTTLFSHLGEGDFLVVVNDVMGCQDTSSFTLTAPSALTLDDSKTTILKPECGGDTTGIIQIQAVGGSSTAGLYEYTLDYLNPPASLPFPARQVQMGDLTTFDRLIGGNYNLTVTDHYGCAIEQRINVNSNRQLSLDITGSNLACKADSNGFGEVIIQGGSAPYSMTITKNNQSWNSLTGLIEGTSVRLENLPEGEYDLSITDDNNCIYLSSNYMVAVRAPEDTLTLTSSVINASCYQQNNGQAMLLAAGGWNAAPYVFGADLNTLTPDSTINNLAAGNYTFFVQDTSGCTVVTDLTITEPDSLASAVVNTINPVCFGEANGSFELSSAGGTLPYHYSIDTGVTWHNSPYFNELIATDYQIITRDTLGCTTLNFVTLTQPTELQATIVNQINTHCDQPAGSATATITGGTPTYSFEWLDQQGTAISDELLADQLYAETYAFVAQDQVGCMDTLLVNIININEMDVAVDVLQHASCYDTSDASARLNIEFIVPPYQLLWDNGQNSDTVTRLAAGTHSVAVIDGNGCEKNYDFDINQPDSIAMVFETTSPICNGLCTGVVRAVVSGGTGDYNLLWNNGASNDSITNVCAGGYELTILDGNNCPARDSIFLSQPDAEQLPIVDSTFIICEGQTAIVDLSSYNNIEWTFPNGKVLTTSSINTTLEGTYTVNATGLNDCSLAASFEVAQSSKAFNAEFLVPKETFVGDTIVTVSLSKPEPDHVIWVFDESNIIQISKDNIYQELVFTQEGEYQLGINAQSGECFAEQFKTITVYPSDSPFKDEAKLGYQKTGIKYVNIYPNPNYGKFDCDIELHQTGDVYLLVVDQLGNILHRKNEYKINQSTIHISLDNLMAGNYILIVRTDDNEAMSKQFVVE